MSNGNNTIFVERAIKNHEIDVVEAINSRLSSARIPDMHAGSRPILVEVFRRHVRFGGRGEISNPLRLYIVMPVRLFIRVVARLITLRSASRN